MNVSQLNNSIQFTLPSAENLPKEVLRLDKDGFHLNDELIEDAGRAYVLFREWLDWAHSEVKPDLFGMVSAFHEKFELEPTSQPDFPIDEIAKLKNKHLQEELDEIVKGLAERNLEEYFDGLIDLVYVALGAAYLGRLPFNEGFKRVHEANMKKVRALRAEDSKRGSTYDIVKPAGFVAPTLTDLIRKEKE